MERQLLSFVFLFLSISVDSKPRFRVWGVFVGALVRMVISQPLSGLWFHLSFIPSFSSLASVKEWWPFGYCRIVGALLVRLVLFPRGLDFSRAVNESLDRLSCVSSYPCVVCGYGCGCGCVHAGRAVHRIRNSD